LTVLALARGPLVLVLAWLVLGAAMAGGLYEAAFAALTRRYGYEARGAITGITLFAGFASTVGWPLTAWLEQTWGWRGACGAWSVLHLGPGLPLMPGRSRATSARRASPPAPEPRGRAASSNSPRAASSIRW
jgi:predicted MFS family arabinose efflux permease